MGLVNDIEEVGSRDDPEEPMSTSTTEPKGLIDDFPGGENCCDRMTVRHVDSLSPCLTHYDSGIDSPVLSVALSFCRTVAVEMSITAVMNYFESMCGKRAMYELVDQYVRWVKNVYAPEVSRNLCNQWGITLCQRSVYRHLERLVREGLTTRTLLAKGCLVIANYPFIPEKAAAAYCHVIILGRGVTRPR